MADDRRAGFTLIELLAVVAAIAVLVAIAVPILSNARAGARAAQCLSNLRQAGVGLQLYLLHHDDTFPVMVAIRESREEPEAAIDTVLAPYLEDLEVLRCPADNRGLFDASGSSYYWNSALNGQRLGTLNFLTVTDLTRIPVLADKESFHRPGGNPVQFLYADGHAERNLRFFTD